MTAAASDSCRLCAAPARKIFERMLLGKYLVSYYRCEGCGALQTEKPYWLAEAYDERNERFDTGQVQRCLGNAAFLQAMLKAMPECRKLIDVGCGSGLTVRLLRDVGVDAWGYDSYAVPRLCIGFRAAGIEACDAINLCEVAEHLDEPGAAMAQIFSSGAKLIVVQTVGWDGNPDPNWNYLAPEHGQHVFFWSPGAFDYLARKYGKTCFSLNGYVLFADSAVLGRIADPQTGALRPELEAELRDPFFYFCRQLSAVQYSYAIKDNEMLVQSEGTR
jgi:hypothetical protein